MSEHRIDVKPIKVKLLCDNCTMGYMQPTGVKYMVYPPEYEHRCENCGFTVANNKKYPYIEYIEI